MESPVVAKGSATTGFDAETLLWQLNHPKTGENAWFHPLATPSGFEITRNRPWDHPWHRGLWFSWKYLNDINFWNEDPHTGEPAGRVNVEFVGTAPTPADGTTVDLRLTWRDPAGSILLSERRCLTMGRAESGCYRISWDCEFTATVDVELTRTPRVHEPGGYAHGGYAGLCLRVVPSLASPEYIGDGVCRGLDLHGRRSAWLLLASPIAEVAIMQHPENRDAPSPWHIFASDYGPSQAGMGVNPAPLFDGGWHLTAGQRLRLRYAVVVSSEPLGGRMDTLYADYAAGHQPS